MNRRRQPFGRARLRAGQQPTVAIIESGILRNERFTIPLWAHLVSALIRFLARATVRTVATAVRYWPITAPLAVIAYAWHRLGTAGLIATALTLATVTTVVCLTWRWLAPASYATWVAEPVRGVYRWHRVYARRWRHAMDGCGLLQTHDGGEYPPQLRSARANRVADTLRLELAPGLTPAKVVDATEALRHVFRAYRCTAREDGPGCVLVRFFHADPLTDVITPAPIPALPGTDTGRAPTGAEALDVLRRLQLARSEDGTPWLLDLVQTHVLVAGSQGAGKGSVIWSLLRQVAPLIKAGLVQVWGIDPKGGMELRMGRDLFHRYADDSPDSMVSLLEEAASVMDARTSRLAGVSRFHIPTVAEPFVLVVVDEMADLTAHAPDTSITKRTKSAMSRLLAKGRAPGFAVVASVVDPRKDVIPFRDLFPTRIAMRLAEPEQTDLVLGDKARDRGADASTIPRSLPGVAFVHTSTADDPHPARVRFTYVTDDDIHTLVTTYRPTGPNSPSGGGRVIDLTSPSLEGAPA